MNVPLIDRYCLHCKKIIPKNKNGDFCSHECKNDYETKMMEKKWESLSIRSNLKKKLVDIQNSFKQTKIGLSDIIDLLIDIIKRDDIDIEKEYFRNV